MMKKAMLMIGVLVLPVSSGWALDKGDFENISETDFRYILQAFTNIRLYYPVAGDDRLMVSELTPGQAGGLSSIHYATPLFFNPEGARNYQTRHGGEDLTVDQVRWASAVDVLMALYSHRNTPPSNDKETPDFVIFDKADNEQVEFEYLLDERTREPYSFEIKGVRLIPTFVVKAEAAKHQQKLKAQGIVVNRAKLDEKRLFNFIISNHENGFVTVLVGHLQN